MAASRIWARPAGSARLVVAPAPGAVTRLRRDGMLGGLHGYIMAVARAVVAQPTHSSSKTAGAAISLSISVVVEAVLAHDLAGVLADERRRPPGGPRVSRRSRSWSRSARSDRAGMLLGDDQAEPASRDRRGRQRPNPIVGDLARHPALVEQQRTTPRRSASAEHGSRRSRELGVVAARAAARRRSASSSSQVRAAESASTRRRAIRVVGHGDAQPAVGGLVEAVERAQAELHPIEVRPRQGLTVGLSEAIEATSSPALRIEVSTLCGSPVRARW